MEVEVEAKVYILTDGQNRIIHVEGGETQPKDKTGWILIDQGKGDRFQLAQNHYFSKPIRDDRGICRYAYENGEVRERTAAEMDGDWTEPVAYIPADERIAELEGQVKSLFKYQGLTAVETGQGVYAIVKEEKPIGDYTHPIPYEAGMTVEAGKFYTVGDDVWEALRDGAPEYFGDSYFDVIVL